LPPRAEAGIGSTDQFQSKEGPSLSIRLGRCGATSCPTKSQLLAATAAPKVKSKKVANAYGDARAGLVTRFRAVPAPGYAAAVCLLWVLTFIVGSYIYTKYRIYVRIPIEQAGHWMTQGFFDFKEHIASIGLVLLPAYWYFWKNAHDPDYDTPRKMLTVILCVACWFLFIVGHVLNNTRGFGS
jgi:hypothetical protein